ncbi:MAG: stage II sporulation protein M [Defluviitaleaceae bacterium]|nr:stage II sporulation protein M [Defluviitaleaceae bacterium]
MTEATFITKNENAWKSLESLNHQVAKSGVRALAPEEVKEFARLFRLASHHLAYVKTHFPQSHMLPYLNRVVGVTHNYFYVRQSRAVSDIRGYFTHTFPRAVRETYRFWVLATALFVLGMLFAGGYVAADLSRLHDIMPPGFGHFDVTEVPDLGDGAVPWEYSLMAATITTNNITVTFNAIAGGLLAGLGTAFILIYNGLIVGGLFGFFHSAGANMTVAYALVLPHGVIELAAIFLSGGCGLMLAKGLLIPGEYTRRQALVMQGKKAATLIPGIVAMLVVAGIIEGYFTPLPIDPWWKLAFAALTGIGLVAYCLPRRVGRQKEAWLDAGKDKA